MTLPLLILDVESYFDHRFSLRNMSIQEYVCDPRYDDHGLAIMYPEGKTAFRGDVSLSLAELQASYGETLEEALVVMHNAYFDYAVLNWRYGIRIRNIFDTMLASYHVFGHPASGGGSASLEGVAKRLGLGCKGDLAFMEGVRHPGPVELQRLREYANNDLLLAREIALRLLPKISNPRVELPIMAQTVRMFVERPMRIDLRRVRRAIRRSSQRVKDHLRGLEVKAEDVGSDSVFSSLLEGALAKTHRPLPVKAGKNGLIPATAKTDEAMQNLAQDDDPVVRQLARARLAKKSANQMHARLRHLARVGGLRNGNASFQLVCYRARTGRFAGAGGFNIQNIPAPKRCRTKGEKNAATMLRRCIRAPKGKSLVAVDAAQIEARVLAWVAGEQVLLDEFAANRNVYCSFGTACLGRDVRKPDPTDTSAEAETMRALYNTSKCAVLGLGYGMGVERFMSSLKNDLSTSALFTSKVLDQAKCAALVYGYRDRYAQISGLWKSLSEAFLAAVRGMETKVGPLVFLRQRESVIVQLPSGRCLSYPNAREVPGLPREVHYIGRDGRAATFAPRQMEMVYGKDTRLYGPKIAENAVQAIARDVLVEAILRLERLGWPVYLHIHDEVILCVDSDQAAAAKTTAIKALSTAPSWAEGLPLAAEGEVGRSLAFGG